jgi:GNAT superfamily N-acetyltransferase
MAVVPQLRRYGIGSKLLKRALDWAKERKAKKVRLETITRLEGALALYQNFGFQKSNHLKAHAKRANIVMEKTLD